MITKTEYLQFLKAPLHLWASKNDKVEAGPSLHDQHLMKQGQEVEALAQIFVEECLLPEVEVEVEYQKTYSDGKFQVRVDILTRSLNDNIVDIYEVKSETAIKKEDKYDVTFQRLVCEANENVGSVWASGGI